MSIYGYTIFFNFLGCEWNESVVVGDKEDHHLQLKHVNGISPRSLSQNQMDLLQTAEERWVLRSRAKSVTRHVLNTWFATYHLTVNWKLGELQPLEFLSNS